MYSMRSSDCYWFVFERSVSTRTDPLQSRFYSITALRASRLSSDSISDCANYE